MSTRLSLIKTSRDLKFINECTRNILFITNTSHGRQEFDTRGVVVVVTLKYTVQLTEYPTGL